MISIIWVSMIIISVVFGTLTGNIENVTTAMTEGAKEAVTLSINLVAVICLWSGIMEIVVSCSIVTKLKKILVIPLKLIFSKKVIDDSKAINDITANVTANLLGISNAATPMGLRAVERIYDIYDRKGSPDDVLMLMVLNASSIQIIPTTVVAIRSSYGAIDPFSVMPAIWCTSAISVLGAILSAKALKHIWKE